MACHCGIQLQFTGFDRPQRMDAAPWRVHLTGEDAIAGTGGQTETTVHAGIPSASQIAAVGQDRIFVENGLINFRACSWLREPNSDRVDLEV